ncbi:uncharacterized protein LOC125032864 [Penaeus chinensis]|uniref:uncharacterized protein LOC125032864 n=1 Tax=Penaeus chinensis TaxID=139456 RepID=UPI001FB781DA|nr:uncharacterized protein LOC125032864 [Penaeus chinensis]
MSKPQRLLSAQGQSMMQEGGRQQRPPLPSHTKFEGLDPAPPPPPIDKPLAVVDDEGPAEYIDTATGKRTTEPKPCCGCRTCDFRFPLEMDEETSKVYREAKYCGLSYTFISSWCLMLVFGTVAAGGIVAVGFLDPKMLQYQIVGIILAIVFGVGLPVFIVFWVCVQREARDIRRQYRVMKNKEQVYKEENNALTDDMKKKNNQKDEEEKEVEKNKNDIKVDVESPRTPGAAKRGHIDEEMLALIEAVTTKKNVVLGKSDNRIIAQVKNNA